MRAKPFSPLAGLFALAVLVGACSESPTAVPTAASRRSPTGPSLNVVQAQASHLTVCASGPAGTYSYTVATSAGTQGTPVSTASFPFGTSFTLVNDECKDVVILTAPAGTTQDPPTKATVTQTSGPANTALATVWLTQEANDQPPCNDPCGIDTQAPGPTVSVTVNFFHGSVIDFSNSEVVHTSGGCTLTLGFWKNHTTVWPSPFLPSATFFNSGKTWLYELSAPPKGGDAYLILAHQWIAATLNIASGASVPAAVQSAYDSATNYFKTGVGSDPKGWAATLDDYNNGLAAGGPSHCS
jgi:hypothetical protein